MRLDPEIAAAAPAVVAGGDDWSVRQLREAIDAQLTARLPRTPVWPRVRSREVRIAAEHGLVSARWYWLPGSAAGPAAVYLHGGGFVGGSIDLFDPVVSEYVALSGVPMLSVDYRRAPEATREGPGDDAFAALLWLREHAGELGVETGRIAVMGDSAGGGLAAGVALRARDADIPLGAQILIYPMLDDRTRASDPSIAELVTWTWAWNATAWDALLDGGPPVPALAPARASRLDGLAPAYIEVGELDIFRDEDVDYAARLLAAGVSTELHVRVGAPHGFERRAPAAGISRRAVADRVRVLSSLREKI